MKKTVIRLISHSVLAATVIAGCGQMNSLQSMNPTQDHHSMHGSMMSEKAAMTFAADLRVHLNALLGEHMLIAAVATSHALGGRDVPFKGAVSALDANSIDIAK